MYKFKKLPLTLLILIFISGCDINEELNKNKKLTLKSFINKKDIICKSNHNNKNSFKINIKDYDYIHNLGNLIPKDKNKPYLIFHISECSTFI